jgi:NAD+ synthase (glutamine-hydrolysing)
VPVIRLALAQMNAVVGGFAQNVETLGRFRFQAGGVGADLVVSPELSLIGYPPEDLLLKEGFIESSRVALLELAMATGLPPLLVGTVASEGPDVVLAPSSDGRDVVHPSMDEPKRGHIANVLVALGEDEVRATATKRLLPNYDVFDEQRYFHPGVGPQTIINVAGVAVGLLICEDVWTEHGPAAELAAQGATLLVVANASPFARGRRDEREAMLRERALETNCPIAYVNLVGGQDELVFDGQSLVVDASGTVIARAGAFSEELLVCEIEARASLAGTVVPTPLADGDPRPTSLHTNHIAEAPSEIAEIYQALVMGTRDYVRKNGFRSAVLGLSGGVDSSLVATIAVDALGAQAVRGLALPSRYSSDHSVSDAQDVARRLDIELVMMPIEGAHHAFAEIIAEALGEGPSGLTDENLQARVRSVLWMAVSNATGAIVCTTGPRLRRHQGRLQDARLRALSLPQRGRRRARRPRADPGERAREVAVGRAASRPVRRPVPAALQRARPPARALRRR